MNPTAHHHPDLTTPLPPLHVAGVDVRPGLAVAWQVLREEVPRPLREVRLRRPEGVPGGQRLVGLAWNAFEPAAHVTFARVLRSEGAAVPVPRPPPLPPKPPPNPPANE